MSDQDRVPHRQITPEAGTELILLFLVLAMIVAAMLFFKQREKSQDGDSERDWYYQHVDRKGSPRAGAPAQPNR